MTRPLRTFLCGLALVLAGCSSGKNPNGGDGGTLNGSDGGSDAGTDGGTAHLQSISLAPQNPTLNIQNSTAASQAFTVTATFDDGHSEDVSAKCQFGLGDPTLGSFVGATFTSNVTKGGVTQVTANLGGIHVSTTLTLIEHKTFTSGSGLPSDPSTPFGGPADASKNPALVYPNDNVLLPPNLGKLEFHFKPKSTSELFQLSFENAITDVKVYLTCGTPVNGGCVYLPDSSVWQALADGNRGGDPVTVLVKEADSGGTGVGTSNAIHLSFSHDDVSGGLYYWTTSTFSDGVKTAIMRYDFAGTQTSATRFLTANDTLKPDGGSNSVNCLGCHALSPDGTKIVAEVNGQNDGRILMYDVTNSAPLVDFPAADTSIFESWNPDGTQFVGSDVDNSNDALRIHDGNTGVAVATLAGTGDATHPADHPDWSPDGQRIAYVKIGDMGSTNVGGGVGNSGGTAQRMHEGAIELISRQADGGWSAPTELVGRTTNVNNYYPAFSPDNASLVFVRSSCLNGGGSADITCDADTDPTAAMYMLPLDGGSPVALAKANAPGPMDTLADGGTQTWLTNSFPRWSPFETQRTKDGSSKVMWLTFSSTRHYGLYTPPAGGPEAVVGNGTQIWMVGIDPAKLAAGQDPSFAPFQLPFQDVTTSNHIAQWTKTVVAGACTEYGGTCDPNGANTCCAGLSCQLGTGDPPVSQCLPAINARGGGGATSMVR